MENISRRTVLLGSAAVGAALLPALYTHADTTAELTAGDWFTQVKAQHVAIASTIERLLGDYSASSNRAAILVELSYLLTAHSVAEENVLYPALIFHGFTVDSADLYLEQQFQKVTNAKIDLAAAAGEAGAELLKEITKLNNEIREHAKVHEEGDYYPKLYSALTAAENATLSVAFRSAFETVKVP